MHMFTAGGGHLQEGGGARGDGEDTHGARPRGAGGEGATEGEGEKYVY